MLCLTKESVNTATLVHAPVCVCVPHTPHGGLRDASALEIPSGGGPGLNSLPVRIRTGARTLRSTGLQSIPAIAQLSGSRLLRSSAAPHTEARAGSERERVRGAIQILPQRTYTHTQSC